jgi:type II secretory pathway component GspD/PulD (secretin)
MKKVLSVLVVISFLFGSMALARPLFIEAGASSADSTQQTPLRGSFPLKTFSLKYANAETIKSTISDILAEGEGASFNARTNAIVVRASEENLRRISKVIDQLDQPPLQVQVEAKILEIKSGDGDNTQSSVVGTDWQFQKAGNPNDYVQLLTSDLMNRVASSAVQGLYAQAIRGDGQAYVQALQRYTNYDLLASPWVTALNHEPADILIGSKYGYQTSIISQTSTVQQINYLEVGTKLRFTPHINEDGYVIMEIAPAVSEGSVSDKGLPSENTTETHNKVMVKDGQSIVIGGLTKNYNQQVETGTPILKDIPFLGALFRKTELKTEKRNLMVVITPHIVNAAWLEQMSKKAKDFEKEREDKSHGDSQLIH